MGILDKFHLDGKLALITGSATGLGAAIAVAMAEAGASVACHGNRRPAEETSERIRSLGRHSLGFAADLSRPDGADTLYQAVSGAMGAPDVVVNNAGTIYREPAENTDLEAWMTVVQVNLNSVFRLMPACRAQHAGETPGQDNQHRIPASRFKAAFAFPLTQRQRAGWHNSPRRWPTNGPRATCR